MEEKDIINAVEGFSITNMFPLLGSALSERASVKNEEVHRFIQDVLIEVNTKLWRLEKRVDKDYMKKKDFVNFLHKTLVKVALDLREEKIKMFANIIVNSTLQGIADENDGRKYLYNETIDKLDENLFDFLLKVSSRKILLGNNINDGWKGDEEDLRILGVDEKSFFYNADYLMSVGVIVRLPRFNVKNGHMLYHDEYFISQYGQAFVDYLKEQG